MAWGGLLILGSPAALAESKSINVGVSATVTPLFEVRATPRNAQPDENIILTENEADINTISTTKEKPKIIRERKPDRIVYTIYTL